MTAFADLAQATAWVFDLQKFGIKFGLSSTLSLLDRLGLDYRQGRYIHVAGTNGKGSVAAMLSAILSRAGYPVGMFTSPHLVNFRERFRLGDKEVSPDQLLALINAVRAAVDIAEPPTFFEFATAMAFLYFLQAGAAPIILETGMGGRLDATNIVQPVVSVITNTPGITRNTWARGFWPSPGKKRGSSSPARPWSPTPGKNRCSSCSTGTAGRRAPLSTRVALTLKPGENPAGLLIISAWRANSPV